MRNTKCVSKRFSSNEWPAPGALRWCLKATGWMDGLALPPHWDLKAPPPHSVQCVSCPRVGDSASCSDEETEMSGIIVTSSDQQMSVASVSGSVRVSRWLRESTCRVTVPSRGCFCLFHFIVSVLYKSRQAFKVGAPVSKLFIYNSVNVGVLDWNSIFCCLVCSNFTSELSVWQMQIGSILALQCGR